VSPRTHRHSKRTSAGPTEQFKFGLKFKNSLIDRRGVASREIGLDPTRFSSRQSMRRRRFGSSAALLSRLNRSAPLSRLERMIVALIRGKVLSK
jgi:hypothetical protein